MIYQRVLLYIEFKTYVSNNHNFIVHRSQNTYQLNT